MDLNQFYNYDVHISRPQNTEIGEPELNNVGGEYQDMNELVINNTILNSRWKPIN